MSRSRTITLKVSTCLYLTNVFYKVPEEELYKYAKTHPRDVKSMRRRIVNKLKKAIERFYQTMVKLNEQKKEIADENVVAMQKIDEDYRAQSQGKTPEEQKQIAVERDIVKQVKMRDLKVDERIKEIEDRQDKIVKTDGEKKADIELEVDEESFLINIFDEALAKVIADEAVLELEEALGV